MCAINGFNFNAKDLVLKMNKITSHRGPDGSGFFCDEGISVGHNRLSIIDTSESASQPMKSFDGNLIIIFNGEIYNFRELKKELSNYPFKTNSDTEVILAAYQKWGKNCVKKFNGIFAFAIWDKLKKELFLARDHIGVKPLYYFWDGKKFIFSSEIKAILEHDVPRILERETFNHYMRILYAPEPFTMFKGIKKLPPATRMILKNSSLIIDKYWEPEKGNYEKSSKKEIEKKLKEKVFKAVERQLVSDKPIGLYLSGGIDSTVVLDNVLRIGNNLDAFSVGFELSNEEEKEKFNQDLNLAKRTARHYGVKHHEVLLSPLDVVEYLEKSIWHMDEPIANPTALAMLKLAQFTKSKGVDVVLGGDGGDELFGGYERYRLSLISSRCGQIVPEKLRSLLASFAGDRFKKLNTKAGIDRFSLFMFQKDNILREVIGDKIFDKYVSKYFFGKKYFSNNPFDSFEELLMDTDRQSWLVDESLVRTDKMSMAAGLEARVPLLDKDLVEFSLAVPFKYKLGYLSGKKIFKESFKGDIPNFILKQPKRGWFSPAAKWLRNKDVMIMAKNTLSKEYNSETSSLFNWEGVETIFNDHVARRKYNLNILWSILVFQKWAKMYNVKMF